MGPGFITEVSTSNPMLMSKTQLRNIIVTKTLKKQCRFLSNFFDI
jgi:hypothetical protein